MARFIVVAVRIYTDSGPDMMKQVMYIHDEQIVAESEPHPLNGEQWGDLFDACTTLVKED